MASFRVTPCKLRDGWLVPKKGEPSKSVTWKELCALVAPSGTITARQNIRKCAAQNTFVLLLRHQSGTVTNTMFRNPDMSGDIRNLLKRDPTVEQRIVGAFRFDEVLWDDSVVEPEVVR